MVGVQSIPSPAISADERSHEVDHPSSLVARFGADQPLRLDCGVDLSPFQIAYQTYGELNAERTNAILICHALTLDQHVANVHPLTGKPGWWEIMVGPGRPLDTDKYFIICSNVIGGCMGSTGPASTNPATGKVWGLDFPVVTITKKGDVYLNGKPITLDGLKPAIQAQFGKAKGVFVAADAQAIWDPIAQVTAVLGEGGFQVNMVTQPEDSTGKGRKR